MDNQSIYQTHWWFALKPFLKPITIEQNTSRRLANPIQENGGYSVTLDSAMTANGNGKDITVRFFAGWGPSILEMLELRDRDKM